MPASKADLPQAATLIGAVFRDLNFNGQRDLNEPGIAGAQISAYNDAGLVAIVTSGADGTYAFLPSQLTPPIRLELSNLPVGFYPSYFNASSGQSAGLVRFVQGLPMTVNFALVNPADYCASNASVATNCYVFGNAVSGPYSASPTIYNFPYQSGTTALDSNLNVRNPTTHSLAIPASAVGSTWGLAYQRESRTLLAAAFSKRHAGYGPAGTGGIYAINIANNTASVLVNLNTLFPNSASPNAGPDLHDNANFFLDNTAWDSVGKTALGGMDVSIDGETLWVMNLFDRRLYRLPIGVPATAPTAAQVTVYNLPSPTGSAGCVADPQTSADELNRNLRPFAVKVTGTSDAGSVYIGMVCSAESTSLATDLRAFVYQLDIASGSFTQVANFNLNYARGCASQDGTGPTGQCASAAWSPWTATQPTAAKYFAPFDEYVDPQPMLSDIEFDDAGNLLVGLSDRFGHQSSEPRTSLGGPASQNSAPAGDLLKLARNADGTFALEQNAAAGALVTQGQNTNQGPGGGEFYWQDHFPVGPASAGLHQEITLGGLAVLPGSGEVLASAYNPTPLNEMVDGSVVSRTIGPVWLNNTTGVRTRSYLLLEQDRPGYFTHATGMGDVELICDAAPVEIGNRVWLDTNANGIQDPSESPMDNVTVRLYDAANNLIATTNTDSDGRYFFNSAGVDRVIGTADDLAPLGFVASTGRQINSYTIRLDNPANYAAGGVLEGLTPTIPNVSSGANSAARNSKAFTVNGFPSISFTTGKSGQNNDTYDFGMTVPGQLSGRVWIDANHDGLRDPADAGVANSLVTLLGPGPLVLTTTTNANGEYQFAQVPPGNAVLQFAVPQGYTFTYPLAGDVARDSDVTNFAAGRTGTIAIPRALAQMYADAGLWKPRPSVQIRVSTNGDSADALPGPSIPFNSPVNWTYAVTNTGDITLTDISVIDDPQGTIACPAALLGPGKAMTCALSRLALGGQYTNVASVYALDNVTPGQITATNTSHYYGTVNAAIQIKVFTNGEDADAAPGPLIVTTSPVTWTYRVTNTGAVTLTNVIVFDNRLSTVACPKSTLLAGETMTCQRTGQAFTGAYENRATATSVFRVPNLSGNSTAIDYSHYQGVQGATIRGTAWFDTNSNGVYDRGEPPMSNVQVALYRADASDVIAASTTTDYSGAYNFTMLMPGQYIIGMQPRAGYRFTQPLVGDPATDSDVDLMTGRTRALDLGGGQTLSGVNGGMLAQSAGLSIRVLTNYRASSTSPGPLLEMGRPVTWTYLIYNTGNFTLTQIQVVDGVQGPVSCSPGPLGPGAPLVCEKYAVAGPGAYNSIATVSGAYPNIGSDTTPSVLITATDAINYVGGIANLAISQSASPNPTGDTAAVEQNTMITYTLVVSNIGSYTATQIVISDELPSGVALGARIRLAEASPATAQVTATQDGVVSWDLSPLGPGRSTRLVFTVKVLTTPISGTTYTNYAYVSSQQTASLRSNPISHVFRPTVVSLARFTATPQADGTLLEWRTSLELNTFGFVLHRGLSNKFEQATSMGKLIPATNTAGGDYAFFDSSADALVSFYWIEEVTTDGTTGAIFGPISAREQEEVPAVIVPNAVSAAPFGGGVAMPGSPGLVVQPPNPGAGPNAGPNSGDSNTGGVAGSVVGGSLGQSPQSQVAVDAAPVARPNNPQANAVVIPSAQSNTSSATSPAAAAPIVASASEAGNTAAQPPPPPQPSTQSADSSTQPGQPAPAPQANPTAAIEPQANTQANTQTQSQVAGVQVGAHAPTMAQGPAATPVSFSGALLRIGLFVVVALVAASAIIITLILRSVRR